MLKDDDIVTGEQVRGSATGALFFIGFGAVWMYVGLVQAHRAAAHWLELLAVVTATLLSGAWMLMRRSHDLPAGHRTGEEEERASRMFVAVNIIQWVSIGTAVAIFSLLHMPQYVSPAIAILVGLHLLPLAGSFRNPQHYVTAGLLLLWACGCLLLLTGARLSSDAALGTGVILLGSAAVALVRSRSRMRSGLRAALQRRVQA